MPIVLITGANRGLGKALTREFAETHDLILHSRDVMELLLPNAINVVGDLRENETLWKLEEAACESGLDILINNAGVYCSNRFVDTSIENRRDVLETNLIAPIHLTKLLWPILSEYQGMVININSLAALQGGPGEAVYSASKAGLMGFSETLQFDATSAGIRVLNVNLGGMDTDMAGQRQGRDKFIDPNDAARVIFNLCQNYRSLRITSIDIKRRLY